MISMILLPLTALYVGLLAWVSYKFKNWRTRIAVLVFLLSPVIYYVGTYQYVQYEHAKACDREGGLKVLIQPESDDQIQLSADSFDEAYAKGLLFEYSPRLKAVEAWDGKYNGDGKKTGYFVYTPDPTTSSMPKKDWKFFKIPMLEPSAGQYVITQTANVASDVTTTTTKLERNGRVYATWTMFQHYWTRNPGMPVSWQCFRAGSLEASGRYPHRVLAQLILK